MERLDHPEEGGRTGPRPKPRRISRPPKWPRPEHYILDEVPGPLNLVLWRVALDARLWALAPVEVRLTLFRKHQSFINGTTGEVISSCPNISRPAASLLALARFPELASEREVSTACLQVSNWAESSGFLETALHFAEVAAMTSESPELAAKAGYLAMRLADFNRAASWFQRTIHLSRRPRDWVWYIRGYLRLGALFFQMGRHDLARPKYRRAHKAAIRRGQVALAAQAYHDLLTLESDVGTFEKGEEYAARALELYPLRHPRLPHLAHDYAFFLVRNGFYSRAASLLEHLPPDLYEDRYRIVLFGTVARAAAGIRSRHSYERAAQEVLRRSRISEEFAPPAIIHIGEGARAFGEWELAEGYAALALDMAIRRRDVTAQRLARALLDAISVREPALTDQRPPRESRIPLITGRLVRAVGKSAAPESLRGAALGENTENGFDYFAGVVQGTMTRPPDPMDPPFSSA